MDLIDRYLVAVRRYLPRARSTTTSSPSWPTACAPRPRARTGAEPATQRGGAVGAVEAARSPMAHGQPLPAAAIPDRSGAVSVLSPGADDGGVLGGAADHARGR